MILIVEKAFLFHYLKKAPSLVQHLYTMALVLFGFLIFRFEDVSQIVFYFGEMLGVGVGKLFDKISLYQVRKLLPLIVIAVIGCTPYPKKAARWLLDRKQMMHAAIPLFTLGLFLLCIAYLVDSTFSPFAYLQF